MAFSTEIVKTRDGVLEKSYLIVDETKACEIAVQKELINAIKELTIVLRNRGK